MHITARGRQQTPPANPTPPHPTTPLRPVVYELPCAGEGAWSRGNKGVLHACVYSKCVWKVRLCVCMCVEGGYGGGVG